MKTNDGGPAVRIEYETRKSGLVVAYSNDLPGLLVTGRTREEVDERLPRAISEIADAMLTARTRVPGAE